MRHANSVGKPNPGTMARRNRPARTHGYHIGRHSSPAQAELTMTTQTQQLRLLLRRLEQALHACDRWHTMPLAAEAFISRDSLCVATMSFAESLPWVFIGPLQALVDANSALPRRSQVSSLAEQLWKDQREASLLV